ncbi:TetR/AcrR family transcriptional regulator [Glaciihabitans sp. UYNi722]|uniref:TetR/AcrR family transcriptional regulator n=1 Tax=Glaciihabitans sp. UYNi722 TaxID=3156344 RepID=UPI003393C48B
MKSKSRLRLPSTRRRALILQAATEVFGRYGYNGATTEQIASAAEVSQPYVVRMFGTKELLFLEVIEGTIETLLTTFRTAISKHAETGQPPAELPRVLGALWIDLGGSPGLHESLLHAFVQGSNPVIGERAREGFLQIWEMLRDEAGFDQATTHEFLARGMLISVLLGIRMPNTVTADARAHEMLASVFGANLQKVESEHGASI